MKDKKLGLFSGTSYAVGSIIGSGILFLPSLTYKLSLNNVFLSWLLATVLCIPLLIMFYDMSKVLNNNEGVKGFIELGLGKNLGSCLPILMLSTVSIGMPSSALIVGKFAQDYFKMSGMEYIVASYLVLFGVLSNLIGKSMGAKIQNFVSISFLIVAAVLFTLTTPEASKGYEKIVPNFNLSQTFSGLTLAFWAFAGFENLTFITQDFKDPKRDFLLSMIIALIVCGILYLGITANYAAIIPLDRVEPVMGLFQLSQVVEPREFSRLIIVILSFFALKTNFSSWMRGLSSMIKVSAEKGNLPEILKIGNRPVYLLGFLFCITLILSVIFPQFLETALIIVSSNFVIIYVLCTLSFLKISKSKSKKVMALITLSTLILSLATSKEKLLYPVIVIGLSYLVFRFKIGKLAPIVPVLILVGPTFSYANVRELKVAVVLRYDDKFNGTTQSLVKGIEFAEREIEKGGKVKIKITHYSHNEKLSTVVEATQKAVKDGHLVIVGGENSDEAMAIAETIKGKKIVLVTPTSTNPRVTTGRPFVFRTCVSDDKVADKMAEFVFSKLKASSVGILHNVSYPYSDYLSKRFTQKLNELIYKSSTSQSQRPKILSKKIIRNQPDFSDEIKTFKAQGVTHLVLLSFQSDLLRFQSQSLKEGFSPVYVGSDGWGLNEAVFDKIIKNNPQTANFVGLRNVYWDGESSNQVNSIFKTKFLKAYNSSANPWAAIAFDSLNIISQSFLDINGNADGEKLRSALKKFKGKNLLTTEEFSFDENNSPNQDVIIYRIDKQGIGFYGKI